MRSGAPRKRPDPEARTRVVSPELGNPQISARGVFVRMREMNGSRGRKRRAALFDLYRKNLLAFEKDQLHLQVRKDDGSHTFVPLGHIYICPLCLRAFGESALDESLHPPPLTVEDVPPKSVTRGTSRTRLLTCRKCNNEAGTAAESHLERVLAWSDLRPGHADEPRRVTLKAEEAHVHARLRIDSDGRHRYDIVGDAAEAGRSEFFENLERTRRFSLVMARPDLVRSQAALLKTAYLLAFASYGYSYIFSTTTLQLLRDRIATPESSSIADRGILQLPDDLQVGLRSRSINIVQKPVDLQSLLVVFSLRRVDAMRSWAVFLPGPGCEAELLYRNLESLAGQDLSLQTTEILYDPPGMQEPVREPTERHRILRLWSRLTGVV